MIEWRIRYTGPTATPRDVVGPITDPEKVSTKLDKIEAEFRTTKHGWELTPQARLKYPVVVEARYIGHWERPADAVMRQKRANAQGSRL